MSGAAPVDRLAALERIEGELASVLQTAANVLQELSKDKTSAKQVDSHSTQFLKQLNLVETELTKQINYLTQVSTGQPHEGSSYAASKVLQMAWHRLQHARNETSKLDAKRSRAPLQGPPPPYQPAGAAAAHIQQGQVQPGQMQPGQMQPGQMQPGQAPPGYGQQPTG